MPVSASTMPVSIESEPAPVEPLLVEAMVLPSRRTEVTNRTDCSTGKGVEPAGRTLPRTIARPASTKMASKAGAELSADLIPVSLVRSAT